MYSLKSIFFSNVQGTLRDLSKNTHAQAQAQAQIHQNPPRNVNNEVCMQYMPSLVLCLRISFGINYHTHIFVVSIVALFWCVVHTDTMVFVRPHFCWSCLTALHNIFLFWQMEAEASANRGEDVVTMQANAANGHGTS